MFISKYLRFSLNILSLISSLTSLQLESILCMIANLLNILRFVSQLSKCFILVNIPHALENVYSAFVGSTGL